MKEKQSWIGSERGKSPGHRGLGGPGFFGSAVSLPIGKALADHTTNRAIGALHVINPKPDAVTVPKIELGKVAMQMPLRTMLVDADHATFEDREETFDGVGVRVAANPFLGAVVTLSWLAKRQPIARYICAWSVLRWLAVSALSKTILRTCRAVTFSAFAERALPPRSTRVTTGILPL